MIVSGSYAFVCAHGIREQRCYVCGPVFIHKLQENIESPEPRENDLVSPYSHIGGHMYASEAFPLESPDTKLEHQLLQVGNQLLSPPPSLQDLLSLLDQVDFCLSKVGQSPSESMQRALSVSQKALISDQLLTHSDNNVKVAVASCLIEITRITAPDPPYDDEKMKIVFHLIISSLENISDNSCQSFKKRVTILETIVEVRIYMLMLDLECDNLILEMFCCFLRNIRDYHPENVFSSMERIMTLILEEREDINVKLFAAILASAKKNKEEVLPIARKLGEKVLENCSTKLKPYISQAVKQVGTPIEDYSDVISSLCQAALSSEEHDEFPIGSKKMGTAIDKPSESFMRNGSTLKLEVKKETGKPICQSWNSDRNFNFPLYRPRLLLCGSESVGLDHLGPAVLHELEKFPVHSLGLPDPEEALVHIFGEARRTTPSILYLPQFHHWWETAYEQFRAVMLSLLEELPYDPPILLLGTASSTFVEIDEKASFVFPRSCIHKIDPPSKEDRSLFFDSLIEAVFSVLVEVEAEQHALCRMRLRDVCNRILYDKRISVFHYPVLDEDAPNYCLVIQNPMDVATLLHRVVSRLYITSSAFMQDVALIVSNAKAYNGDDYNGARNISRVYELRDVVQGMLSQMDSVLATICDKIVVQGGPLPITTDLVGSPFILAPVAQLGTVTRASACLWNVQTEVNMGQGYEALKRPKKNVDSAHHSVGEDKLQNQDSSPPKATHEPEINEAYVDPFLPPSIDFDPANSAFPTCHNTTREDKIEAILDEQMVFTNEGEVQRFLVRWGGHPNSKRTWMSRDVLQYLDPDLLELFQSHQNFSLPNYEIVRKDVQSKPPITLVYGRRQKVVQPLNLWSGD